MFQLHGLMIRNNCWQLQQITALHKTYILLIQYPTHYEFLYANIYLLYIVCFMVGNILEVPEKGLEVTLSAIVSLNFE